MNPDHFIQVTLQQHGFETCWATIRRFFFKKVWRPRPLYLGLTVLVLYPMYCHHSSLPHSITKTFYSCCVRTLLLLCIFHPNGLLLVWLKKSSHIMFTLSQLLVLSPSIIPNANEISTVFKS